MSMVGSDGGGGCGSLPGSAPGSQPGSPRNRVKFLCSHGGKILPRPADGQLKYVGGETRVISVPRDITFPELMKKLTYLIDCDMLLKYQLMPEDLDALVSVKSDEDLRHMFEEYDRHEVHGYPRLRTFLFPANPIIIENQLGSMDRHTLEQRYINSINGIIHPSYNKPPPISVSHASFTISSACSSPRSPTPDSCPTDGSSNHDNNYFYNSGPRSSLHRIQSSPSMYNLIGQQSQNTSSSPQIHHYHYYQQQPGRHHQAPSPHHHQPPHKPPLDRSYHGPPEQLMKVRSVGRAETSRYQVDQLLSPCRPPSKGGIMCCNKCLNYDDYGHYGNNRVERGESYLGSPSLPQSPRQGYATKAWD